jgi:3-hydroxyisobutyrate dehydrogenase/2-hydroxy-3-oxopropionate reductase
MTVVAVLGTGRMGSAMARALRRAGHDLVLYNRTEASARSLAGELEARVAASPAEAVAGADVALTMLADRSAVEETYWRPGGVLEGVRDGLVLLEMSTVEPDLSRALEPEVRAAGGALLDAPVSGSVSLAESGQLTIMVGGEAAAVERARPVLDALATRVFHMGPAGSGAAMKLAVNAVIFALDVALSEALVLAERAGVDRAAAYDVLQASAVGAPFVGYKRAAFLEPDTTPTAFALDLATKDLGLITALAERVGLPVAQARTNVDLIRAAAATEGGERDFASVASYLRTRGGRDGGGEASSG